jgi:hypothetical protein
MSQIILGPDGQQFATGWIPRIAESQRWAAANCLATDDDFWEAIRAKNAELTALYKTEDRYWYRLVTTCFQWADSNWIKQDGDYWRLVSLSQKSVGSCVGHGACEEQTANQAVDILGRGQGERLETWFCPEVSYGLSRECCGMLGDRGDGSTGFGAAKGNMELGCLPKGVYGSIDLREYNEARCRDYGYRGVPAELKALCKPFTTKKYIKVTTAEQVWLLAGVGVPINFCSSQGFENQNRNDEGMLKPSGSWMHSMMGAHARRVSAKYGKLVLIQQSWGDGWCGGPYWLDQPGGSFYAELAVVGRMAAQGDTFAQWDMGGVAADKAWVFTEM